MMKLVLLSALVAVALADVSSLFGKPARYPSYVQPPHYPTPASLPLPRPEVYGKLVPRIAILKSYSDSNPDGSFQWSYETENGISAQEQGVFKPLAPEGAVVVQGSYQYSSPEGVPVQIGYVADENGYQPTGNVLPIAPPTPEAILKSLAYNAAYPEPSKKYY